MQSPPVAVRARQKESAQKGGPAHLVAPGEGDGPSLEAADELLAGDVALGVAHHAPGHDEREDPGAAPVGQLGEPVEERHHRCIPTRPPAPLLASSAPRPSLRRRPLGSPPPPTRAEATGSLREGFGWWPLCPAITELHGLELFVDGLRWVARSGVAY